MIMQTNQYLSKRILRDENLDVSIKIVSSHNIYHHVN